MRLTSNKQRIAGKYSMLITVLCEIADAIQRVTWGVQRSNSYSVSNFESITVFWCRGDKLTVSATNNRKRLAKVFELLLDVRHDIYKGLYERFVSARSFTYDLRIPTGVVIVTRC